MTVQELLEYLDKKVTIIRQKHPYGFDHGKDPISIIVGTAPPRRFCHTFRDLFRTRDYDEGGVNLLDDDEKYYYGSNDNAFWEYLYKAFGIDKKNQKDIDKNAFIKENKLAFQDVLKEFYRRDASSIDKDLYPIYFNEIANNCERHKSIKRIYTTSQQTTEWLLFHIVKSLNITNSTKKNKPKNITYWCDRFSITDGKPDRCIEIITLPSPSGAAGHNPDDLVNSWIEAFKPHIDELKNPKIRKSQIL